MAKTTDSLSSFHALQKSISLGKFSPIYLLHGDEPFFIDAICDQLEESILPESERGFNQSVLYGKELKMNDLVSMARRYPMMSKYQVIIVKEAKDLKDWDKFESYANHPVDSTILVFCHKGGKMDMRSKAAKAIAKHEVLLTEKLKEFQIRTWISDKVKAEGRSMDITAIELIMDYVGDDLSTLNNELVKLFISVKEDFIKASHVEANVGQSRKYSVFEFQKALGQRNYTKSIQIANHMASDMDRAEYFPMLAMLFKFFSKVTQIHYLDNRTDAAVAQAVGVHPFFVGDYTIAARNYRLVDLEKVFNELKTLDLKLKGMHSGTAEGGQLLMEAVIKILRN